MITTQIESIHATRKAFQSDLFFLALAGGATWVAAAGAVWLFCYAMSTGYFPAVFIAAVLTGITFLSATLVHIFAGEITVKVFPST
ncbi:MAG: hypothetical protein AAB908_02075 [Patescibacteria group bacterium]